MEEKVKKQVRNTKIQQAILSSLEVAGVLTIAIMAPNVLQLLGKKYTKRSPDYVRSASQRLVEKGLIAWDMNGGNKFLRLTPKGQRMIGRKMTIEKPKRWDGKWRIVTFDIAQKRSAQRTRLRKTLQEIGFERLQDSVWVFPYDCEELITLLKADYGLGKEVLYIIADAIERDSVIRRHFNL